MVVDRARRPVQGGDPVKVTEVDPAPPARPDVLIQLTFDEAVDLALAAWNDGSPSPLDEIGYEGGMFYGMPESVLVEARRRIGDG